MGGRAKGQPVVKSLLSPQKQIKKITQLRCEERGHDHWQLKGLSSGVREAVISDPERRNSTPKIPLGWGSGSPFRGALRLPLSLYCHPPLFSLSLSHSAWAQDGQEGLSMAEPGWGGGNTGMGLVV